MQEKFERENFAIKKVCELKSSLGVKFAMRKSRGQKISDMLFAGLDISNENNWWGEKLSVRKTRDEKNHEKKNTWGEKFAMRKL